MMRGLTFWRPWSDAIVRGPKRVENRSWPPPERMLGKIIAIHAGKKYDKGDWPMPEGYSAPSPGDSPEGIVGVARILGALDARGREHTGFAPKRRILQSLAVDGDAGELARRLYELDDDPWWAGPCGWLLDDVVAIDPVPVKGAMGLWTLPPDVERVVRERWERARAA